MSPIMFKMMMMVMTMTMRRMLMVLLVNVADNVGRTGHISDDRDLRLP